MERRKKLFQRFVPQIATAFGLQVGALILDSSHIPVVSGHAFDAVGTAVIARYLIAPFVAITGRRKPGIEAGLAIGGVSLFELSQKIIPAFGTFDTKDLAAITLGGLGYYVSQKLFTRDRS